jgi:hypothetical protein
MKKRIILISVIIIFCLAVNGSATSMEFLNIPVGARPVALGNAYSALADDVNAVNYNPAGLGHIDSSEIEFTHSKWIDTLSYENIAFGQPLSIGTIGFNIFYLHMNPFEETDFYGPVGREIGYSDLAVTAAYGIRTDLINIGGSIRYALSSLADSYASLLSFSFGMQHAIEIPKLERSIKYSICLNNIGNDVRYESKKEPIPAGLTAGLYVPVLDIGRHKVDLMTDFNHPFAYDIQPTLSTGMEYTLSEIIFVRAGYRFNTDVNGITGGIGINYYNVGFSYALYPFGDLGFTHIISARIRISKLIEDIKKK